MTVNRGNFTDKELRTLARMWRAGFSDREIGIELNRATNGIGNKRVALGLVKRNSTPSANIGEPDEARQSRLLLEALLLAHPGGHQDAPFKQARRVNYPRQIEGPQYRSALA